MNTLTYAVLFILISKLVLDCLRRFEIKTDNKFMAGALAYALVGSIIRVYEDFSEATNNVIGPEFLLLEDSIGIKRNLLFITPFVFLTILVIASVFLALSIFLEKKYKIPYHKTWISLAILLGIFFTFNISFSRIEPLLLTTLFTSLIVFVIYMFRKKFKFLTPENITVLSFHIFDASTTFVALQFYGYTEQHFLPGIVIGILGPWSMFLLKILVVSFVLRQIDLSEKNIEKRRLIKLVISVLGLVPGARNLLRMMSGV